LLNQIAAIHGTGVAPAPTAPVAGYRAWYDASDTATITVSGTAVTQWNDKSANGYNLTQSTAAYRPLSGTRTLNSLNVIDFDGSNDCLTNATASNWTFLNNSTGSSIFIVLYSDATATTGFVMSTDQGDSSLIGMDFIRNGADDTVRVFVRNANSGDGAVGSTNQGVLTDNTAVYYTLLLTPNNGTTADRAISRINGGSEIKNNTFTLAPSSSNPAQGIVLGDYVQGGGLGFNGTIAEIIFYPSALNATDRASNETYLKNKWGL
jgi:hypothetical protein